MYSDWEMEEGGAEELALEEFVQSKQYQLVRKCLVYRASENNEKLVVSLDPATKGALLETMAIIHFFDGYLPQKEDEQVEEDESSLLDSLEG